MRATIINLVPDDYSRVIRMNPVELQESTGNSFDVSKQAPGFNRSTKVRKSSGV